MCACLESHSFKFWTPQAVTHRPELFNRLLKMEGKAAGVKLSTLQHRKRFHNLCGIHFIESLNGRGGQGVSGRDEVVIQIVKKSVIAESVCGDDGSRNC